MALLERIPLYLDTQLNRYTAATAIIDAIDLAKKYQYDNAVRKLSEAIEKIKSSTSSDESFCEDLHTDLNDCINNMRNPEVFETKGIHIAHAYASMYFMERSAGTAFRSRDGMGRHIGYGYVTQDQATEAKQALNHAQRYVSAYLPSDVDIAVC